MAYQFSLADVGYLTSAAGADALCAAAGLPLTAATLLNDLTAAQKITSQHAAAVVETVRLRRRAEPKLGKRSAGWLFTDESVQQASPWPVAEHRAVRMAGSGVHDVTCSIGTDLAALAAAGCRPLLGSDLDQVRLAMAHVNVPGIPLIQADALTPTSAALTPYADPARRTAGGRRITSIDTVPSVVELDAVYLDRPPVLRLPPGIDYDELRRPGEVEIVSLDGTAREAVLWPTAFADGAVRRRASVLTSAGISWQLTDVDGDGGAATMAGPASGWIVDPDAAVVRAHLVRHYAARHGLHLLDQHLAYLTGDRRPAGVRAFEVLDIAPFTERTIAGWLRRDGVGTLEIKQRGTPVIPDELRHRLRPSMTSDTRTEATLIVARIGDAPTAFWCRAREPTSTG
ncbi:MAG: class I SAM-dependent methyltransferase [Actinomycetota bacterium]|nr:class I SAM-dependent methyltransferase [Actinomycetota bacterium]